MALKNKYQRQKQQYSTDGGSTWLDVSPANYRRGRLLEAASEDCNTVEWREVLGSWFCIEFAETVYRWVDSGTYDCVVGDKYPIEKEQVSHNGGSSWEDTGETRYGDIIRNSNDCSIDYDEEYFTIEVLSDEITIFPEYYSVLEYKVDNGEWQLCDNNGIDATLGQKIQFRGHLVSTNRNAFTTLRNEGQFKVFGNINSLYDYDNFTDNCYDYQMFFYYNHNLIDAENLILPATTMRPLAYKCMFNGCDNLINTPELPATTLAENCYSQMFKDCHSITSAPVLPATVMAVGCYHQMFGNCIGLLTPPALPSTSLAAGCYYQMFANCWVMTSAPQLPATIMFQDCYFYMFQDCKNITTAPELPATKLAYACYEGMFWQCISLVNVPLTLPATTLYGYCYQNMFRGCTSLTTAPVLPSGTFENNNEDNCMEGGTPSPYAIYCYSDMFRGCTSLNYIKMMVADIPDNSNYSITTFMSSWVYQVAATGTFVKNSQATWSEVGMNGIPNGWSIETDLRYTRWVTVSGEYECDGMDKYTKEKQQLTTDGGQTWTDTGATRPGTLVETGSSYCDNDYSNKYLTFVALENGTFSHNNTYDTVQYSVNDGSTWITLAGNRQTPTITAGSKILWKSNVSNVEFASTGRFNVEGNIMSLGNGDNFIGVTSLGNSQYRTIFANCTNLISAENLILPATTLSIRCYGYMFLGCTSLVTAPQLPATTLSMQCYENMFDGCTSLVTAPALPATTLANFCYGYMFNGCTSLVNAPALPSLSLSGGCYEYMFQNCTSLVNAPALPSTDLAERCYQGMFNGCTSLTTAPELPAINLATYCYMVMFSGCSSLNYIKAMFTTYISSSSYSTSGWVSGVAASGTFVKNSAASWNVIGDNGVPTGWTIETASE